MKRKTFIQLSSAILATPFVSTLEGCSDQKKGNLTNWAGNLTYSTDNVFYPKSVEEIQELVKKTNKLKGLGSQHCFNTIADSKDNLLSLKNLNKVISLDEKAKTVTVESGIKYGELSPYLHEKGFALHNLASLPHISVAGSCATATHGSGVGNGNLATAISALEIVKADGSIVQLSREKDGETFLGAVVNLGALGIVTKVTLDIQPTFMVTQHVYEKLPMVSLEDNFDKIMSAGYSVSLFTDWQSDTVNEVWVKSKMQNGVKNKMGAEFFGAKAATKNLHPIADISAENCTEQMGVAGPWYERLPHFKMGFTPSSGKELQSEFFVPMAKAVDAILAVASLGKEIGPHLMITEIRTIAADNLWMSPHRNQASVAIHFTWKQEMEAVLALLPKIEAALSPYNVRPHWGKIFTIDPKVLASRYEKIEDFKKLVAEFDPTGKFKNDFLRKNLYAEVV